MPRVTGRQEGGAGARGGLRRRGGAVGTWRGPGGSPGAARGGGGGWGSAGPQGILLVLLRGPPGLSEPVQSSDQDALQARLLRGPPALFAADDLVVAGLDRRRLHFEKGLMATLPHRLRKPADQIHGDGRPWL